MQTLRQTESYSLLRDTLQGVTRFIRASDSAVTFWNTGSDAIQEAENVENMTDSEFEEYAESQEFHP